MVYRLTVVFGGKTVERKEVDQNKFVIGRSRECDLVIDNLGISRAHAEIVIEGGVAVVKDLKSNNGTFVNGKRVTRHNLNDGDEVAIGKFLITYQCDEQQRQQQHVEEDTIDEPDDDKDKEKDKEKGEFTVAIDSRLMDQRQRERASKLKAYLTVGEGESKQTVVLDRSLITVGKQPTCDLHVGGFFTARKHCVIFRDETSFRLIDTSQKGRTYLNETSIDDERLKDGDTIRVGRTKIKFMVGVPPV